MTPLTSDRAKAAARMYEMDDYLRNLESYGYPPGECPQPPGTTRGFKFRPFQLSGPGRGD